MEQTENNNLRTVIEHSKKFTDDWSGIRAQICKLLRSPEIDSASLSSLAGRYNNPICRTSPLCYMDSLKVTNSGSHYNSTVHNYFWSVSNY